MVLLSLSFIPATSLGQFTNQSGPSGNSSANSVQATPAQVNSSTYQGSIVKQAPVPGVLPLSLDQAIRMGLQYNLGLVLSGVNAGSAGAQQLQQLQALLPTVNASAKEAVQQTNLQAEGLKIPGFPAVIGPYGYTDIRGSVQWSLLNVSSLRNYLASKHNFEGSKLSIEDAKDMVVLTVGQCVPAVHRRCVAGAIGAGAGKHLQGVARPGGGQPPGGDGAPAGRAARPGGLPDATADLDHGAKPV